MAKKTTQQSTASAQGTQTTQKDKTQNNIRVTGYLRETTLEHRNIDGIDTITGNVTIAFNESQSLQVRCYMPKFQKDRVTPSKHYDDMAQLVEGADGCVSIAKLFADKRVRSFEEAVSGVPAQGNLPAVPAATKVVASGELEEHLYMGKDGQRHSVTRVRCRFLAKVKHEDTFFPSNQFRVIGYVLSNVQDPDTGRVAITLGVPAYNGVVSKIPFKTPSKTDETEISSGVKVGQYAEVAADAISTQYVLGTTVSVLGYICDAKVEKVTAPTEAENKNSFFGIGAQTRTRSEFVHENVVYGGDPEHKPLVEGEPGAFSKDDIQHGIALKEAEFQKQIEKAKQPKVGRVAATPIVSAPNGAAGFGGFGFTAAPKAAPIAAKPAPVADVPPTADEGDDDDEPTETAPVAESRPAQTAAAEDVAGKINSFDF